MVTETERAAARLYIAAQISLGEKISGWVYQVRDGVDPVKASAKKPQKT